MTKHRFRLHIGAILRLGKPVNCIRQLSIYIAISTQLFACGSSEIFTSTAITNVTVIPMTEPDLILPNQTILIEDGVIRTIGHEDEIVISEDTNTIDAQGGYLIPGLADMHVHLEYSSDPRILDLFLANGITRIRSMDGRPYILDWRNDIEQGLRLGPSIVSAGPILDGDPPLREDNLRVSDASLAEQIVNSQIGNGYNFIKVYGNLSVDSYDAILKAAASLGAPVAGHVPREVSIEHALRSGQRSIEHLNDFDLLVESDDSPFNDRFHWSKLIFAMPVDREKVESAANFLAESEVWVVPTAIQADRAMPSLELVRAWLDEPELDVLSQDVLDYWVASSSSQIAQMDESDWTIVATGRKNRLSMIMALEQAHANILIGTDTPNPFVVPGFSLVKELHNFVSAGLTPGRAIQIATRDASVFFEELEEVGTLESGKRADAVLLSDNPLDNIANLRHPLGVMVGGSWLSRSDIDEGVRYFVSKLYCLTYLITDQLPHQAGLRRRCSTEIRSGSNFGLALSISYWRFQCPDTAV